MAIKDILRLDIKDEESKAKLVRVLLKTKWLSKFTTEEELTLDRLESLYKHVSKKYGSRISYIMKASETSYCCCLTHDNVWIDTIYFEGFRECFMKLTLALYGYHILGEKYQQEGN